MTVLSLTPSAIFAATKLGNSTLNDTRSAVILIGFFFITQTPCLSPKMGFQAGCLTFFTAKRKPLKT